MRLLWGTAYEDKCLQITTVYNVSKHQLKLTIGSSVINMNSGGTARVGISLADAHQQAFVCKVIDSSAIVDKDHI